MLNETYMGYGVHASDVTESFYQICEDVSHHGLETAPRGMKVKELLDYSVVVANPRARIVQSKARKTPLRYLLAEWIWYLSGQNHIDSIVDYAPFWATIASEKGTVNSNYGYRIFGMSPDVPYNQWEKVKSILKHDPDSRQAIMHINAGYDYVNSSKDVPCTIALQWFIRENKLHLAVSMRSNDVVLGYTSDFFQFTMLQEMMMVQLKRECFPNLQLGSYMHKAGSMHVYERHFEMLAEIEKEELPTKVISMKPMQLKDSDIANLISFEKEWRTKHESSKEVEAEMTSTAAYQQLSPYWQNLIKYHFFGGDVSLISE